MNLDMTTLMLVLSLGNFLQVMALLVQWRWVKTYRGPGWWTLGTALVGLGFLAAYLRAVPGWVSLAIVATNLLIVGGHICFYVGVLRFFDQREPRGPLLVALALYTAMLIYLTYGHDDMVPRRAMLYLVLAAVSWLGVRALMRCKSRSASGSADFLAAVFLAHGGALMAGALFTVTSPPDPTVLAASAGHLMPALEALISTTLSTFGFILLLNQRLNAELSAAQRDRELIFNTSPDAVTITRLSDGQLVDMNDGFTALTGFTRAEARGRSTLNLSLWKYPADRQQVIAVVTQHGRCDNLEAVFQHQDGSELIGLISAQRLMLQDEPHILSVIRDITPYKQAEVARRESEARFRSCFDQPLIGIAITAMDKGWLEVNDRLCAMLGYTRAELLDTTWVALTHPEDLAADVDQFDRVQRGECDSYSLTKRFIRRDSRTIAVDLSVACVRTPAGIPQYFVALFQEVTQRQAAEQALRASEEKFRLAFANANTGMCLVDLQGQLLQVNAKMSAILGYSPSELIGMSVNTLALDEDHSLSESFIQQALAGRLDSATFEKRYRHRDGQVVYGQVATSLVRDAEGQPRYFISQLQDITGRYAGNSSSARR